MRLVFTLLLVLVSVSTAHAQSSAMAAAVADGALRLDGVPDEAEWQQAQPIGTLTQQRPVEGAPAGGTTDVRFLYTDDALWIGARMTAPNGEGVRASLSRRDQTADAEHLAVWLDTYRDGRTAFVFAATAAGVRVDGIVQNDDQGDVDDSYDPIWEARSRVTDTGWTTEWRIPFSQLRFLADDVQTWGINVGRIAPARNEESYWQLVPLDDDVWVSRFGTLRGIAGVRPSRRIEATPYVATGADVLGDVDAADPFASSTDVTPRIGGDIKAGIGPSLTLTATINPDFGQVEADPATVNLSAFEEFFDERRPFFVEDRDLLEADGPGYFNSRRIGAAPRGRAGGTYVDAPDETTILAATKLTGRLRSGLSIGALAAVTQAEYARTFTPATASAPILEERVRVEPATVSAVARVQQEIDGRVRPFGLDLAPGSTIGTTLTGIRRDQAEGSDLAALLPRQALVGGVDWDLRLGGGTYRLRGFAGYSHVTGDSSAILRQQLSSRRFFQRPDADHLELDASRTTLNGFTGGVNLSKRSGRRWLWNMNASVESPQYEINDLGRLGSTDEVSVNGNVTYRDTEVQGGAARWLRSYGITGGAFSGWTTGGEHTVAEAYVNTNAQLPNFWRFNTHNHIRPRAVSPTATRGGPVVQTPIDWDANFEMEGNPARKLTWEIGGYHRGDELGSRQYNAGFGLEWRASPWLELSVEPGYEYNKQARQYVGTFGGGPIQTQGNRYVFGEIERHNYEVELRAQVIFSPDLSLDLYAEPFASSGRYSALGEVAQPGTMDLRVYGEADDTSISRSDDGDFVVADFDSNTTFGIRNPDFAFTSLRSNVVLRWEWRPGSFLTAVWQQNRDAFERPTGALVRAGNLFDPLDSTGDHLFLVKLTYWIPVG